MDFSVGAFLKITYALEWQKILLNSSLRPGTQETQIEMFFLYLQSCFWVYDGGWRLIFWFFNAPIWVVVFERYLVGVICFFG